MASIVYPNSSAVPTNQAVWLQLVATENRSYLPESEVETEPCAFANLSCVVSVGFGVRPLRFWSWLSNGKGVNVYKVVFQRQRRPGCCYVVVFLRCLVCFIFCVIGNVPIIGAASGSCCACLITCLSSKKDFQRMLFKRCTNKMMESFAFFTVRRKLCVGFS